MNRTKVKNYAPQARRDFIQAMTDRAAFFGLTSDKIEPAVERGDVVVIAGREHPRAIAMKRKQLEDRIKQHGFEQTMEAMAYTWFNRMVAIRFMELHEYLDHGYRVLSHPEDKPTPEILEHAEHVEFPGLKKETAIDLKLAGNKENELYRLLLTAQCNALHTAMPFLFERIDDETELLLPDNLLHSDSLIRKLVSEIDEEDWQEVEIIGWLYQFYISEKKDDVIGKVVASEDIPAATQLFTPNWIVKYLVQNTLGRQWLATYPQSALRQQMQYYIEPAEQTPEVQEQLKAITPNSLNPEEITLLDPACGSGHILVEAYDLFKAIYQERGYRAKDIPALILQKNLFGLEIDDRAAQLAAFALMMKARVDDRRIFEGEAKPNIMAFEESKGMDAAHIAHALNSPINKEDIPAEHLFEEMDEEKAGLFSKKAMAEKGHVSQSDISSLLDLFENAKTFGSLIQVPPNLAAKLPEIEKRLYDVLKHGDLMHTPAHVLKPLLQQARLLARRFDAVVGNPPYMGSKAMCGSLKTFVGTHYPEAKSDLMTCFMERCRTFCITNGWMSMINLPSWLFLSSFEEFRHELLKHVSVSSLLHLGRGIFGSDFGTVAFTIRNHFVKDAEGVYRRLFENQVEVDSVETKEKLFRSASYGYFTCRQDDFQHIPGAPIAYWVSRQLKRAFGKYALLATLADIRIGMATGKNETYVRLWYEPSLGQIEFGSQSRSAARSSGKRWFPYAKGGAFRKWYGNSEFVVDWLDDGKALQTTKHPSGERIWAHNFNLAQIFKPAICWTVVTMSDTGFRYYPHGYLFDAAAGLCQVKDSDDELLVLGSLNTKVTVNLLQLINPTVNLHPGYLGRLPIPREHEQQIRAVVGECLTIARADWDNCETSWGFVGLPLLQPEARAATLTASWQTWRQRCELAITQMQNLETENNRLFIDAYGLQDELSPDVPDEQITLYRPDREEDIKRLLSFAIGCMMGRYSLDKLGLIYANSGNHGFDPSQYKTFGADEDGIIPLLETDWGIRDDAANRIVEFIGVAWPKEHLEENLKFIADSLGPTGNEQPRETIRRYLANGFYKHHLSMYKKRPIYWLFSSGKQRAFQCLVYLHRYTEGTLARMRTEYAIPLQGQIAGRIEQLEGDKAKATSTSHRKKLQKEQDDLKKKQAELLIFEEKLKHAADQKISLDLDDGVKLNYGKFGDLLAESKAITGGEDDQ
jgi:SAM-dependent methyltransferase